MIGNTMKFIRFLSEVKSMLKKKRCILRKMHLKYEE